MKSLWTFLYILLCTLVFLSQARSQHAFAVRYQFEQDTVHIRGNETFANKLLIENLTEESLELTPDAQETMSLQGLIGLPPRIQLGPKEQKRYPLKYIADRRTIHQHLQAFTIGFSSTQQIILAPPISFYTKLENQPALKIRTEQSEFFLDPAVRRVQFMVQVSNTGLVPLTLQLEFSGFPQGFELLESPGPTTLQPGAQALIPFTGRASTGGGTLDFDLRIEARDNAGLLLAHHRVRVAQAGSVQRFGQARTSIADQQNNSVALRYMDLNQFSTVYQLQAQGRLDLTPTKQLSYQVHTDYYKNLNAVNIYDTYLHYEDKKWGVQLGNIYENLDHTLSGRGIKASYKLTDKKALRVYAVDNNYMLYSQLNNLIPGAKIVAASYAFQADDQREGYAHYLHSENDFRGIRSDQWSVKAPISIGSNQQFTFEGGYSFEQAYEGGAAHGLAGGIYYQLQAGLYQLSSANYYSSPYYTGLRRGYFQSDSRIRRQLSDTKSIYGRISLMHNTPQYQSEDRGFFFRNAQQLDIYELGYQRRFKQFNVDVRPYLMVQRLENNLPMLPTSFKQRWRSSSLRTAADIQFFSVNHRASVRVDYGYTYRNTANRPLAPYHSLRVNGNYSNRFVGFSTFIQLNPYYLTDLMSSATRADYRIYSFGPNTQLNLFQGKLQSQVSAMYSYYGFSRSNNFSIQADARWHLKRNWTVTADLYYALIKNTYYYQAQMLPIPNTTSFHSRQFRIGIEKRFAAGHASRVYTLHLTFFDDQNNNGVRDNDEATPEGLLIRLDNNVAFSDHKGQVKFTQMTDGTYTLQVENNRGWTVQGPIRITVTKNKRLNIPLVKTRALTGKVYLTNAKYQADKPSLAGIRVWAVDRQGKEYSTLTDASGTYLFYLPVGAYTLSVSTEGMPFRIENPSIPIIVKEHKKTEVPDFRYQDERRKIGIKRF
ncbi:hypothetical protein [Sphingobacterium suaedae]|uniref:SD-repeat containing protein B domain-containing protein n=1 Tax=Sphingobacterium suaedae TaxID=1686402 RepID=A0ABW5KM79_9SPHI